MKIKINIMLFLAAGFLFFPSAEASAQKLYEYVQPYRTILDASKYVNPYYMGGNPAFLDYEASDELLSVSSSFRNTEGEFKRFIDPPNDKLYQIKASGKKQLDSQQVFKGSFGFRRVERGNWPWLVTRNYIDNPYLMGDSTSGRTYYNGITMNAGYSTSLYNNLLLGFSIDYGVDEGLKVVSPRPTSKHRDIGLNLGAGYKLSNRTIIGFNAGMYDYNEKISYQEDEGAVYKEVTILKFRGYDFPYILKKKTETRYSYQNGISGGTDIYFKPSGKIAVSAFAKAAIEKITVKDDPTDPKSSGFWKNYRYEAGALSFIDLADNWGLGLHYNYIKNDMWAKHPEYSVLLMEGMNDKHCALIGLTYKINAQLKAGLESGIEMTSNDYKDYYSVVSWKSDGRSLITTAAVESRFNDYLSCFLSYGLKSYKCNNSSNIRGPHSNYYLLYRYKDIAFSQTDFLQHNISAKFSIKPGKLGIVNLFIDYTSSSAEDNPVFSNSARNDFSSTLEFRVNVY